MLELTTVIRCIGKRKCVYSVPVSIVLREQVVCFTLLFLRQAAENRSTEQNYSCVNSAKAP